MKIEDLDFTVRTYHCLKRAEIDTVEQLKMLTDEELARIRSIGRKCIEEIRQKVSAPGMTNGDRIRAMNDDELAKIITDTHYFSCPNPGEKCNGRTCTGCFLEWLKQPASI